MWEVIRVSVIDHFRYACLSILGTGRTAADIQLAHQRLAARRLS